MAKLVRVHCSKCGTRLCDTIVGAKQTCKKCGTTTRAIDKNGKGKVVETKQKSMSREVKADVAKSDQKGNPCMCGCGEFTKSKKTRFVPGHDAKLKSILLKVEREELTEDAIPEVARPYLAHCKCCGQPMLEHESGMGPICRAGKCGCKKRQEAKKAKEVTETLADAQERNRKRAGEADQSGFCLSCGRPITDDGAYVKCFPCRVKGQEESE